MFEKDAEERGNEKIKGNNDLARCSRKSYKDGFKEGAEFGYNKAKAESEEKCKTAYIKGIRTMANALKDYDRTDGIWTDYFEHTVDKVLNKLLQESKLWQRKTLKNS